MFTPRTHHFKLPEHKTIKDDKAINRYFNNIKSKAKNNGYLSESTYRHTITTAIIFLKYLNKPITPNAIHDLIQEKRSLPPTNDKLEEQLEYFSNQQPIKSYRNRASAIKGIFRANRCRLDVFVDTHYQTHTRPVSEGILKAIYKTVKPEQQLLIDFQAYSGHRINTLGLLPIDQEAINLGEYTALLILSHQNKTRLEHYTIIPTKLYNTLQHLTKKANRKTHFPNYSNLWREITKIAKSKHGIRLTSHYLRKRYTSIAQDTPMPVNHYDYLQGSKPQSGHEAGTYLIKDLPKFATEYHTYLMPLLPLHTDQTHVTPHRHLKTNNTNSKHGNNTDILLQTILKELQEIKARLPD